MWNGWCTKSGRSDGRDGPSLVIRAVVDTNVLVSAFYGGTPAGVLQLWREGRLTICVTDDILSEYAEVFSRFPRLAAAAGEFMVALAAREGVLHVEVTEQVTAAPDPDDDMFLECAVAARADVIVSGDRHLLALGQFRGIPIQTPTESLAPGDRG